MKDSLMTRTCVPDENHPGAPPSKEVSVSALASEQLSKELTSRAFGELKASGYLDLKSSRIDGGNPKRNDFVMPMTPNVSQQIKASLHDKSPCRTTTTRVAGISWIIELLLGKLKVIWLTFG